MLLQTDFLQESSEQRCSSTKHLIADMELLARADYCVGTQQQPLRIGNDLHCHRWTFFSSIVHTSHGMYNTYSLGLIRVCCAAASFDSTLPHIIETMRFALHLKDRRTFVDASPKHRDWRGLVPALSAIIALP